MKKINTRPAYMDKYKRNDCTNIVNTRSRMFAVKGNYKGKYSDLECRWCNLATETQQHILQDCREFKDITANIPYITYFKDDKEAMATARITLEKVIHKINDMKQ